jgi:hypothetical protein
MWVSDNAILSLAQVNTIKSPSPSSSSMELMERWAKLETADEILRSFCTESGTPDPKKLFAIALRSKSPLHKFIDRSERLQKLFKEVRFNR